ncbi:SDR family NAD(P)-dependent oxidoreductase [uncultured Tateyamaria sp.]|uniref:SDR family NAD(P)-dependent oxidoreductase n=1 Tax=Tateyamaria sp. 1078 TaxID=3417464 RepID=UPI00262CFDD2|nr:SDR family NAD(P)-dependent oxidoreductase [uncultured Tateyamaria sp.]
MTRTALVTGSAGFIGYFTARALIDAGWQVVGLDAMTDYYEVGLKERRRAMLRQTPGYTDIEGRIETPGLLRDLFEQHRFDAVIHLAAQAGVRYSIEAPRSYVEANLMGTFELLEAARAVPPAHMLLASTSSAYGANTDMPYREDMRADHQMSFYAATKKATENMAHSYAHLYDLPITMFRFFTVYGPWGRPDMAHFKFTRAILRGEPIDIYNHGDMRRDFTYIDDLTGAILALIDTVPGDAPVPGDSLSPVAPHRIVNIGNGAPVPLMDFIAAIETACERAAIKTYHDMQPGDVPATWADATLLETLTGNRPSTPIQEGIDAFVGWYRDYYQV